jgi:hypothetical protein
MVGSADSTHAEIVYTLSGNILTETVTSMAFGNQRAMMTPAPAGAAGRVSTITIVGDKLTITYTDGASQSVQTYERVP